MRVLKRLFKSQDGATLTNTIIGAALMSGVAVLVSQGIVQQRTQSVELNAGSACQVGIKNVMDSVKSADNNRQGFINWEPSRFQTAVPGAQTRSYDPNNADPRRYNFKLVHTAALEPEVGPLNNPVFPAAMDTIQITAPFDDSACGGLGCTPEHTAYQDAAILEAASSSYTYQNLNSAVTKLAYLYNDDTDYCDAANGLVVDGDPVWNGIIDINTIAGITGLGNYQNMTAKIERINLTTGAVDCGDQGNFQPIPAGDVSGAGSLSPYGLKLTLTAMFLDNENVLKGCNSSNVFSQAQLASSPSAGNITINPVDPATRPDPNEPNYCGTGPSAVGAGDQESPEIEVVLSPVGEGALAFCRVEFMDSNRGLPVANPFAGAAGTSAAGYAYADSGWFLCKAPPTNFEAGVDPASIDPDDIRGTLLNDTDSPATINIYNKSNSSQLPTLHLTDLPEGKFTISSFVIDASRSASSIVTSSFYVDLFRPIAATGIQPDPNGIVGQFDDPNVRINEFRSMFPNVENISALESTVRGQFRSNNKIFQCKPGSSTFTMDGFEEMYPITDGGVRWYFGPSDVTDAALNTYLQYTQAQIDAFNIATPTAHPLKNHDKELIVEPVGTFDATGPDLNVSNESGEWVAIALPKDECGSGYAQETSRRSWIVDFTHRPEAAPGAQDATGGITVNIQNGAASLVRRNPSFNYAYTGTKPDHLVGQVANNRYLPHLYICELAGPPAGGQEAPGNTDKSFYEYNVHDLYNTFPVPHTDYDPVNGRYDLMYGAYIAPATVSTCIQTNFQNACIADASSKVGVAAVDACGRVAGDDMGYTVEGYSDGAGRQDVCKQIQCAPGYYCDKNSSGDGVTGLCKTFEEINWSGLAARAGGGSGAYPFQNCSGTGCSAPIACGVNSDCANDVGTGSPSCSSSNLSCTGNGQPYSTGTNAPGTLVTPTSLDGPSNTSGFINSPTIPRCMPTSVWSDKEWDNGSNASSFEECTYYNDGAACDFEKTHTNTWVRHSSNGLRACPSASTGYYDWRGYTTSSCTTYDSTTPVSCTPYGVDTQCTTPGARRYCNSGRSKVANYGWNFQSSTACTVVAGGCTSVSWATLVDNDECGVDICLLGDITTGSGQCNVPADMPSQICTNIDFGTKCRRNTCVCITSTPASNSCDALPSCSTFPGCDALSEGDTWTCHSSGQERTYRCDLNSYTCNAPYMQCDLRSGAPPWVSQNTNVTIEYNGSCNVSPGSCNLSGLTRSQSNTGALDNLNCPNLDPLSPICSTVSCADQEANYCSGVNFSMTMPACQGGGSLSCSGTTTPDCSHLGAGYTLLAGQTQAQCLAAGYTDCRSASTSCTGQTYTCGAITTCRTGEISYSGASAMADCISVHGAAGCTSLTVGSGVCGQGCHSSIVATGQSEAACNAGLDWACTQLHPDTNPNSQRYCATQCDSSNGGTTYTSEAACIADTGLTSCMATTVMDLTSTPIGQPKVVYCGVEANTGCNIGETKFDDYYECLDANGNDSSKCREVYQSGTCTNLTSCSGLKVHPNNYNFACNGSSVGVGSSVNASCCSSGSNCEYNQLYSYIDDGGNQHSHPVMCATGTNYSWNNIGNTRDIGKFSCEAGSANAQSCDNASNQCNGPGDVGNTCIRIPGLCNDFGTTRTTEFTCMATGGSTVGAKSWTTGPCGDLPEKFRRVGTTAETNCDASPMSSSRCKYDEWASPDCSGKMNREFVVFWGSKWIEELDAAIASDCSDRGGHGYDVEVYCTPGSASTDCHKHWCAPAAAAPGSACASDEIEFSTLATCTASGATGCREISGSGEEWRQDYYGGLTPACPTEYHGSKGNCMYNDGTRDTPTPERDGGFFPDPGKCTAAGQTATCSHCGTGDYDFITVHFECVDASTSVFCGRPPASAAGCTVDKFELTRVPSGPVFDCNISDIRITNNLGSSSSCNVNMNMITIGSTSLPAINTAPGAVTNHNAGSTGFLTSTSCQLDYSVTCPANAPNKSGDCDGQSTDLTGPNGSWYGTPCTCSP